jgi:hypothetical protein
MIHHFYFDGNSQRRKNPINQPMNTREPHCIEKLTPKCSATRILGVAEYLALIISKLITKPLQATEIQPWRISDLIHDIHGVHLGIHLDDR